MRGDRKARVHGNSKMFRCIYPALSYFAPSKIVLRFDQDKVH